MGEATPGDTHPPDLLFSDKCFNGGCYTPRKVGIEACRMLLELGVQKCPGKATDGVLKICSFPGEVAEVIGERYAGVPDIVVLSGAHKIVDGKLSVPNLPQPGEPQVNKMNWATIILGDVAPGQPS